MADHHSTILVVGATGAQGGSVARHLLEGGKFHVRALTRKPDSEKANALRAAGAEVAQGDLGDPASLRAALDGCAGCFGVTNFWEHFDQEVAHGRNLIAAVADSGVRHFVFSTLPHVEKATGGRLKSPHFDQKAKLEDETRERGLPATFVHAAAYYDNFIHFYPPQKQEDGSYAFGFPLGDGLLNGIAVADIGGVVAPLFAEREQFLGKAVPLVGDLLTGARHAELMSRILGKQIVYQPIPRETYAAFDFPGAADLADMFDFYRAHPPYDETDVARCRHLYPQLQTFEQWLEANKEQFSAVLT